MSFKLALVIPATLMLAGCLNEPIGARDGAIGEAVKYDAALQTINPDPVYPPGSAQPGDNGDVAAKAVQRYRTGAVIQVEEQSAGGGAVSVGAGPP